jgi:UDP-N-acetylmuramate dehydrogenase
MYSHFVTDKKLSEITTLGIGGPARYFVEVKEIAFMQELLRFCKAEKLKFHILGKGSNTLFLDAGFNGLVILNKIDFCKESSKGYFEVGAGFSFSLLGMQTAKKGYTGLEFAAGIPAAVGGAVYMNAGAQGTETKNSLVMVEFVDEDGNLHALKKEELIFSYRYSSFQKMKGAIVAAHFQLEPSVEARKKQLELLEYRIRTQPYHEKSAGCIFRNPEGLSCGALIDKCGLKGTVVGGAKVSEVHANFLVNSNSATAQDFLALMDLVKGKIKEFHGIDLDHEIRIIS